MYQHKPRLQDKVAIITGAGSSGPGVGNGKAAALLFAREGSYHYRSNLNPLQVFYFDKYCIF